MVAGGGIVHSERSPSSEREVFSRLHGSQLWIALPDNCEEIDPSFVHHPASTLPEVQIGESRIRLLLGKAFGIDSPVQVLSHLFYAELKMPSGAQLALPGGEDERAVYRFTAR